MFNRWYHTYNNLYFCINLFILGVLYLDTKTVNVLKLCLIPYLVSTKTQIKKAQRKSWKPSLAESAAAFAVHVTVSTLYFEINYF